MFSRNNIIAAVIAITVLVVLFSAPDRVGKYYPADEVHLEARSSSSKRNRHEACGKCHFEGGEYPVPDNHVKRKRCYGCHAPQPEEGAEGEIAEEKSKE